MLRWLPRLLFVLALLTFAWQPGLAQQAPPPQGPLMGSEAMAEPPAAAPEEMKASYNILVIGDALAGGMGAGLSRMAEPMPELTVINRFKDSSGLARSEVYDWPNALQKIMAAKPVDVVVVMVGLNDRQEIRDGNMRFVFRSPEWVARYQKTADRLLDAAAAGKAKVMWLGLPPMADNGFDADMQYISDLLKQRAAAKGATFVDLRSALLGADGRYVDVGPDDTGAERKLRARDGIAFMRQGNNRLGQIVLQAVLTLRGQQPPVEAAVPTIASVPPPPVANAAEAVVMAAPSFGQDGLDGETLSFRADEIAARPFVTGKPAATPKASDGEGVGYVRLSAQKGSMSEQLFQSGQVPKAPRGRFDDFAVPPLPQAP